MANDAVQSNIQKKWQYIGTSIYRLMPQGEAQILIGELQRAHPDQRLELLTSRCGTPAAVKCGDALQMIRSLEMELRNSASSDT